MGHQPPGVLDEIPQHGKGPGGEKNALLGRALTTPEALVDGVEPERRKLSHRSANRGEKRTSLGGAERATRLFSPPSQRTMLNIY